MVDPSGMGHRMKIKCIVSGCGYEKEVDNGIHLTEVEMFHLTRTGHQGWSIEHLEEVEKG
jgi:hypothetical protein